MKPLWVNRIGTITSGALAGTSGNVVGFDSTNDKATIQLDPITRVVISSDHIEQHDKKEKAQTPPEHNLMQIAVSLRRGYTLGDKWELIINTDVWNDMNSNDVDEIADAILDGETSSRLPYNWELKLS